MHKTYKTEGIVLKRMDFGEADRIITLYSKDQGKIRLISKGVRKMTSRKGGNIELFNHISIFAVEGKNLDILSEVEVTNDYKIWRSDLNCVGVAYYFCEIIDKLTPDNEPHFSLFLLLAEYLDKIGKNPPFNLVRGFEERLLKELGYGIPEEIQEKKGSLKTYIESLTEKTIMTPRILKKLS